jgi:hypothetical protein
VGARGRRFGGGGVGWAWGVCARGAGGGALGPRGGAGGGGRGIVKGGAVDTQGERQAELEAAGGPGARQGDRAAGRPGGWGTGQPGWRAGGRRPGGRGARRGQGGSGTGSLSLYTSKPVTLTRAAGCGDPRCRIGGAQGEGTCQWVCGGSK